MNPDKELLNFWLHKNDFFTINSIKAGKNKEINIIALKIKEGQIHKVQQIEVVSSISNISSLTLDQSDAEKSVNDFISRKFEDEFIKQTVKEKIKEFGKLVDEYERVVIMGRLAKVNRDRTIELLEQKGVKVIKYEDVLFEILSSVDKQDYNEIIRTTQLLKYLLLADPKNLAKLIEQGDFLNQNTREEFVKEIVKLEETKRVLCKEDNEGLLVELLRDSSLKKPEKLAKLIAKDMLTSRTRQRFLDEFLKVLDVQVVEDQINDKRQKALRDFA
jgi:uncharacterized protein (UPF0297 family)